MGVTKETFIERMERLYFQWCRLQDWVNRGEDIIEPNYLYEIYDFNVIDDAAAWMEFDITNNPKSNLLNYIICQCDFNLKNATLWCGETEINFSSWEDVWDYLVKYERK